MKVDNDKSNNGNDSHLTINRPCHVLCVALSMLIIFLYIKIGKREGKKYGDVRSRAQPCICITVDAMRNASCMILGCHGGATHTHTHTHTQQKMFSFAHFAPFTKFLLQHIFPSESFTEGRCTKKTQNLDINSNLSNFRSFELFFTDMFSFSQQGMRFFSDLINF